MFNWLKKLVLPTSTNNQKDLSDVGAVDESSPSSVPQEPPVSAPSKPTIVPSRGPGKPRTLSAELENKHLERPLIFEPALRQYSAFRAGEPVFASEAAEKRWFRLRSRVLQHILKQVSQSPASEHLVLRGSLLMSLWFGQNARRPGDIDWVVIPKLWGFATPQAIDLIENIENCLKGTQVEGELAFTIPDREFASDDIWMYEKAPGKRLIIPWECEDPTLNGTVQMDLVFEETMPSEPVLINIAPQDEPAVQLMAASAEQSLAWKILWLETDAYGQGKDLYDAVLLAENTTLSVDVLRETFLAATTSYSSYPNPIHQFDADAILNWHIEWEDFKKEYPQIPDTEEQWKHRLIRGLDSLLTQLHQ